MFRKLMCGLAAVGAVVALGLPVMAGQTLGSIQVTLAQGEDRAAGGSVSLYQVGVPAGPDYSLTEAFGSGIIKGEDALSSILARWLADSVEEAGLEKPLDGEGSAEFSGLPEGLYLLVQTQPSVGFYPMEPILVTLPYEYQWHVQAFPKCEIMDIPATGQPMEPFLGAAGMVLSGSGLLLCRRRRK
ncbi:MAG: LPXTG cell wall anchor domain-containing protein [Eubacteriales bacterium]|nr:LPXTG cell wall anchor domain-containing protein [Eubacteriales bacterium]